MRKRRRRRTSIGLKRSFVLLLTVTASAATAGCGGTEDDPVDPGPAPTPEIALSLGATMGSVEQGMSTTVTATVTRSGGFTGNVTVEVAGAPAGVTASVAANTTGTTTTATITIEAAESAAAGTAALTIRASGAGVVARTASFQLTVTERPSLELALQPPTVTAAQGASAGVAVTVTRTNFAGPVTLTLEGPDPTPGFGPASGPLPGGVTATFDPNPVTGTTSTLTIDIGGATVPNSYALTVRAVAEGLDDRRANLGLTVEAVGQPINVRFEPNEIAVGSSHSCRLDAAGAAFCWGSDFTGELGNGGANQTAATPTAVSGGLQFTWIAAGAGFACGLTDAGQAHCWGSDAQGQLGNDAAFANQSTPVAVAGGHTFVGISASGTNACGLTEAGEAWCWGGDFLGQLGNGPPNQNQSLPVRVGPDITFGALSVGTTVACGIDVTGGAWCWGNDGWGELGDGLPVQSRNAPVEVAGDKTFVLIAAGDRHACALDPNDQAWCWGADFGGQVGDGDPVAAQCGTFDCAPMPVAVAGGHSFARIFEGGDHICGIDMAGAAWCWGQDDQGQLGDGAGSPAQCSNGGCARAPNAVIGGHTFRALEASLWNTCGVDVAGDAWCWGDDSSEGLGDGVGLTDRAAPVKVGGLP